MNNQLQIDLLRYPLRKKETAAKAVPYISFILTNVALVLFLVLSFFVNDLVGSTTNRLEIKIGLAILAVLFLASEWVYAIVTSRRWKKDISLLLQLEEEQLKNRQLQSNLQRQRNQYGSQGRSHTIRSVRPDPFGPSPTMSPSSPWPFPETPFRPSTWSFPLSYQPETTSYWNLPNPAAGTPHRDFPAQANRPSYQNFSAQANEASHRNFPDPDAGTPQLPFN